MGKDLRSRILITLAVLVGSILCVFPFHKRINLGLDLQGGMHLILNVETEKLPENAREDAVLRAMEILRNRIDAIGAGETLIQRQGDRQILVQLPGITDREKALSMVSRVAHLEFRLVEDDPAQLEAANTGDVPEGYELKVIKGENNAQVLVSKESAMMGDAIADARYDLDSLGQPKISLTMTGEGGKEFAKLTQENVGRRLAIVLDNEVLSAPSIREPILSGTAEITGDFTFDEANLLSLALRSGALPAPMHVEEERTIGPLLGKDSIKAGIQATVLGAVLVLIFMVLYYLGAGIVAGISLIVNIVMIFGIMGFLNLTLPESPVTLTLPGIAGIILTLGMAVDANVLINERIREELRNGKALLGAINAGFERAFSAIIDSNITTLIAAFMLFQFGSGPIKGFAVTLTIGLMASLFSALFVGKTLFHLFYNVKLIKSLRMLSLFPDTKIDFISKRYFFYAISVAVIAFGLYTIYQKKEAAYGIDFAGGQLQEYRFNEPVSADEIRAALRESNMSDAVIQQFNLHPENVIIRTAADTHDEVTNILREKITDNNFEVLRVEKVGPVVGQALRTRALLAMIFALAGILVYVGFRFKHFDFATAGVIALLHDVLVAMGMLVVLGREIDLLVVTALLTIAGFSINDTIVIYDRVRENMAKFKKLSLREVINLSVNQTLSRTVLTTFTVLMVVVVLYLKGGEVLNTFALCLLIGFISGTYSTVFIASPLVLAWHRNKK